MRTQAATEIPFENCNQESSLGAGQRKAVNRPTHHVTEFQEVEYDHVESKLDLVNGPQNKRC